MGQTKAQKAAKAAKLGAAPKSQAELDAEKLAADVDKETKAPADVATEEAKAVPPVTEDDIVEEKVEGGKKGEVVRKLRKPTGHFVSIGKEIFNRQGALVGTEATESDAARKTDRFNSLKAN